MFEKLKQLFRSSHSLPERMEPKVSTTKDGAGVVSINLDKLTQREQEDFRKAMAAKFQMPFHDGEIKHGYSAAAGYGTAKCPRCASTTEQRYASFIYATQIAPRAMLLPGSFCSKCPTVIVDEDIILKGIAKGFEYRGVVGVESKNPEAPDLLHTWNGKKPIFMFDEDETLIGVATEDMLRLSSSVSQQNAPKDMRKAARRRELARSSRKRNRQRR